MEEIYLNTDDLGSDYHLLDSVTADVYRIRLDDEVVQASNYRNILKLLETQTKNDTNYWKISTIGGDLYTAIELINAIRSSESYNIAEVILGSSAGSLVALACDECMVLPHGEMFIHEIQSFHQGDTSKIFKDIQFLKRKQKELMQDVYKHFLSDEEIEDIMNGNIRDLTLDANECKARLENRSKILKESSEDDIFGDADEDTDLDINVLTGEISTNSDIKMQPSESEKHDYLSILSKEISKVTDNELDFIEWFEEYYPDHIYKGR